MTDRQLPRDDTELEQMTGIKPADHNYVSTAAIDKMERQMLGPDWYRKRKPPEDDDAQPV